eukprot:1995756-Pyramimonas_sp.AAC.1
MVAVMVRSSSRSSGGVILAEVVGREAVLGIVHSRSSRSSTASRLNNTRSSRSNSNTGSRRMCGERKNADSNWQQQQSDE